MDPVIKEFQMSEILPDSIIFCIGPRKSGKSWLIRELILSHKQINNGQIYSNTEHLNPFYEGLGNNIKKDFSDDDLGDIIKSQVEKICKDGRTLNNNIKNQVEKIRKDGRTLDNNMLLVIDDHNQPDIWKQSNSIKQVIFHSRHFNILFIMSLLLFPQHKRQFCGK